MVPGGYLIIDDYRAWEGCRKAVHEFRDKHGITIDLSQNIFLANVSLNFYLYFSQNFDVFFKKPLS